MDECRDGLETDGLALAELLPRIGRGRPRQQVLDLARAMADDTQLHSQYYLRV